MPAANLLVDWGRLQSESNRLRLLRSSLGSLEPGHRKLVAEIAMIRLFLLLEGTIESVTAKLICGAPYLDGTSPTLLASAASASAAAKLMRCRGRARPKAYLKWTNSTDVADNVKYVLDPADPYYGTLGNHSVNFDEMRKVRNHIAHGSASTKTKFQDVIKTYYGGLRRGVTPGLLLLTPAFGTPGVFDKYVIWTRTFVKDLVRA